MFFINTLIILLYKIHFFFPRRLYNGPGNVINCKIQLGTLCSYQKRKGLSLKDQFTETSPNKVIVRGRSALADTVFMLSLPDGRCVISLPF